MTVWHCIMNYMALAGITLALFVGYNSRYRNTFGPVVEGDIDVMFFSVLLSLAAPAGFCFITTRWVSKLMSSD